MIVYLSRLQTLIVARVFISIVIESRFCNRAVGSSNLERNDTLPFNLRMLSE